MAVIFGTNFSESLGGTVASDRLEGFGGNDTLFASFGSDLMVGGNGIDTADYRYLGRAMSIGLGSTININKGGLGFDRLFGVERIVGSRGFANWIDGLGGTGRESFNVDLVANRLTVNGLPGIGSFPFTVFNFFNVRGTNNSDSLAGNNFGNSLDGAAGNDVLTGRGGHDTLVGGTGSDVLNGTDGSFRGNREFDRLTGGFDRDLFVLGDRFGSYYRNGVASDFAQITDLNFNDFIQLGAGDVYRAVRDVSGFDLFVARNGGFDLIADVRTSFFTRLPSGNFWLASGQVFGNFVGA